MPFVFDFEQRPDSALRRDDYEAECPPDSESGRVHFHKGKSTGESMLHSRVFL